MLRRLVRPRAPWWHVAFVAAIAVLACFLYAACFSRDPIKAQEGLETYRRVHEYLREIGNGHWLPQLFPDAVRGAGSAFPTFYPPLAYYVTVALSWVLGDIVRGVNLSFLLSVVLSGWAMYFCVTRIAEDRLVAFACALLYISFPYRFVDVFARGALAESWSFVWFPLVVAGTWTAIRTRSFPWYLPLAWAGLILTHVGLSLYFGIPYALIVAFALWARGWRSALAPVVAFALAVGLAFWFIVPQQHLLHGVRASSPRLMDADTAFVVRNRVPAHRLTGTVRNGLRGPSHVERLPDGTACPHYLCGLDFSLGTGHYVLFVLTAAWLVVFVVDRRRGRGRAADGRRRRWFGAALLAGYAFCITFMIWPHPYLAVLPSAFGYVQYPWRLLGIVAPLAVVCIAVLAVSRAFPGWVRYAVLAASIPIAVFVPAFQKHPAFYRGTTQHDIVAALPRTGDRGFTVEGEYLPKAVNPNDVGPSLIPGPEVRGAGHVVRWERTGGDVRVSVTLTEPGVVVFPLLYYPVYRVTSTTAGRLSTFDDRGLLAARVPAGTTTLHVSHALTTLEVLALGVSGASLAALVVVVAARRRRPRPGGPEHQKSDDAGEPLASAVAG